VVHDTYPFGAGRGRGRSAGTALLKLAVSHLRHPPRLLLLLLLLLLGLLLELLLELLLQLLLELLLHLAVSHLKHPRQLHRCMELCLRSRCNKRCNRHVHASICGPEGSMRYEPCRLGHGIGEHRSHICIRSNYRSSNLFLDHEIVLLLMLAQGLLRLLLLLGLLLELLLELLLLGS